MTNPKSEIQNPKQIRTDETRNPKRYDLEDRVVVFAKRVRMLIAALPKTISNLEDSKQLARSSGSVGANYMEANEAVSRKDFVLRIKISRKEAKETGYWLQLLDTGGQRFLEDQRVDLLRESGELLKIFGAIYRKSE